jgi:MFS family permease
MSSASGVAQAPGPGAGPVLRHNRDWHRLWLAQAVSLTGDSVFDVTIMLWVASVIAKGRPWAPAAASGVLIAAAVPVLAVGPLAGVWIDRWDRRRIMMTADAGRAALMTLLLLVPALGHELSTAAELAAVYAVVAAESCFSQFFNPARLAVLGLIVAPADRPQASGMLQATSSTASIIGPPLAAPMLFALGVQWALVIDAVSFAVSFAAIRSVRMPAIDRHAQERPGFLAEFRMGLRFFASSRILVALSTGVVICTLGTGAVNALAVFFLRDNLHTGVGWLGTLYAAMAIGGVGGALLGAWTARRIGAARVFWLAMITGGLLLLAYSRLTQFPVALAVGGLVGSMFGALNAAAPPLLLAAIPQHLMGRVMSVFNPLQQVANVTSIAAAGFLAGTVWPGMHLTVAGVRFGAVDSIFAVSALLIIIGGLAMIGPLSKATTAGAGDAVNLTVRHGGSGKLARTARDRG